MSNHPPLIKITLPEFAKGYHIGRGEPHAPLTDAKLVEELIDVFGEYDSQLQSEQVEFSIGFLMGWLSTQPLPLQDQERARTSEERACRLTELLGPFILSQNGQALLDHILRVWTFFEHLEHIGNACLRKAATPMNSITELEEG